MRGIQGQIAVRCALRPTVGSGLASAQSGPIIDTQGFRSAAFFFTFDVSNRETEEIFVNSLLVRESSDPAMGSATEIWTCGTSPTIRGAASTLPRYEDPDFPSSEGQQPRVLIIPDLTHRKRYMQASIVTDLAGGSGETDYSGLCYLMDPIESLTTDEDIAGPNGQAVYIAGGTL